MNHSLRILFGLATAITLGFAGWPLGSNAAESAATVEACGIRVTGPVVGDDFQDSVRPFNMFEGTTVALLVRRPAGGIIEMDRDASKVTRFEDNTGKDLLKKPESKGGRTRFSGEGGFGMMPDIKKDGTVAMLELDAPGLPAKAATSLKAQGTIQLLCASTKKRFKQDIEFKVGSKVTVGPVPLEITKVGKPDWGDAALAVTFAANQELDAIAGISFSSGNTKLETRDAGRMSTKAFDKVRVEVTINFEQKVDAATIEIDAWQDLKRVALPFDLTIGLGL